MRLQLPKHLPLSATPSLLVADAPRLGIDWGNARIGVAACNRGTTLAYPVETVTAGEHELSKLRSLIEEYEPAVVYVGLPLALDGTRKIAADKVTEKAAALARHIVDLGIEVRLIDERMSTVSASRSLGAAGKRVKQQRKVIDQAAAVEILQRAIDAEVRDGKPAGELVEEDQCAR